MLLLQYLIILFLFLFVLVETLTGKCNIKIKSAIMLNLTSDGFERHAFSSNDTLVKVKQDPKVFSLRNEKIIQIYSLSQ